MEGLGCVCVFCGSFQQSMPYARRNKIAVFEKLMRVLAWFRLTNQRWHDLMAFVDFHKHLSCCCTSFIVCTCCTLKVTAIAISMCVCRVERTNRRRCVRASCLCASKKNGVSSLVVVGCVVYIYLWRVPVQRKCTVA